MIGSNFNLKPQTASPPTAPVQAAQPAPRANYGGQSSMRKPQYIDINTTEDAVNNTLAQGHQQADQRYQTKQLDRAGISRGAGQQYMAAQEGQQALGQAATQAAEMRASDEKANAAMRADFERMREQEAQAAAMSAHAREQASWSVRFARQQAAADMLMQALMSPSTGFRFIRKSGGGKGPIS